MIRTDIRGVHVPVGTPWVQDIHRVSQKYPFNFGPIGTAKTWNSQKLDNQELEQPRAGPAKSWTSKELEQLIAGTAKSWNSQELEQPRARTPRKSSQLSTNKNLGPPRYPLRVIS